jgi:nucleoside 2-deoxyribosyltransferase
MEKQIQRIYLAGPFFNETEIKNTEYAEKVLEKRGFTFFSPMRHKVDAKPGTMEWSDQIFAMDKVEIHNADAVVALYYGGYSDSGTAWECGYAAAIGKPVILVHADRESNANVMLISGSTTNIYLEDLETYDFETLPAYGYQGKMF